MNTDVVAAALGAAITSGGLVWIVMWRLLQSTDRRVQEQKAEARELERQFQQTQRDAATERNRLEVEHHEHCKKIRSAAFEEGRQLGLAEGQRDHVTELTAKQAQFGEQLATAREEAAREARERTRAEFELQSKLFDINVRPYLKIDKVKGLFKDEQVVEAGYQYQLLVNGIPAFQPSIVIEETRRDAKINEENISALLQVAEKTARAAAEMYLGVGASAAKLGPAVIRRLFK